MQSVICGGFTDSEFHLLEEMHKILGFQQKFCKPWMAVQEHVKIQLVKCQLLLLSANAVNEPWNTQ